MLSQPALESFNPSMILLTSSWETGIKHIVSGIEFAMQKIGDISLPGILLANLGPILE